MAETVKRTRYGAFGLSFISDFHLPELSLIDPELQLTDIVITNRNLLDLWSELSEANRHFVVKKDFVMFSIPGTAIFLIQNGNKILVSPFNDAHDDQIRLYILGTCMGALLMQRKVLPLHGSAIAIDGKAYAIVGDSGAGKSTLASAFLNRGYQLLSDDVIPVSLDDKNVPNVTPAYPQQKLWIESLNEFGINSDKLRPIIDRETKFGVPVHDQFATDPMPLAGVFELVKTDNDEIGINSINNLERLHTLFNHTYRNFLIARLGLMEWHFSISTSAVNKINFYQLQRPIERFTAHNLVDLMLTKLCKGEKIT
ncbi:HPr kinase/phosphorylase [Virgibacillus sp. DJP39]|uniref:HPr kinase/phosphorylase n=1 Tax=Virgibacillus sp. DJP39 TaxID=3409790 RepID=UPI003BB4A783